MQTHNELLTEPVERPPVPQVEGGSRMLRRLMLHVGKIFWARADVWRLLFCKVTTKKVAKNWGPIVVVGGGAHLGLRRHWLLTSITELLPVHGYTHLSIPFFLWLVDSLIRVSHHSDQHVDEQQCHQYHVDDEDYLSKQSLVARVK